MVDYTKFIVRRDEAIARIEASIADWKDKEGLIRNADARKGLQRSIKAAEGRLRALREERKAFVALVEEFKRLDAERAPPLPFGVEGPT